MKLEYWIRLLVTSGAAWGLGFALNIILRHLGVPETTAIWFDFATTCVNSFMLAFLSSPRPRRRMTLHDDMIKEEK